MKKLGLVAVAAVAVLALAGCNNGAQEVVEVSTKKFDYKYDVSGSVKRVISYQKDKKDVTETRTFTATERSYADVEWYDYYNVDTNKYEYTISVSDFSYTYKEYDHWDEKNNEVVYVEVVAEDADGSVKIRKIGDDYYAEFLAPQGSHSASKFAGNASLIKLDEIDPEDDEFTLSYTYTMNLDGWDSDDNKATSVTTVDLTFTRL